MLAMKKIHQKAFTLIELMVVLALLSVLLVLAAPSFKDFHRSSQLTAQVNTFIASLQSAKNEAIKHNVHSYIVPNDGASWASGWRIFLDSDFNGSFTPGTDPVIYESEALPSTLAVAASANTSASANPPHISFDGSGYPRANSGSQMWTLSLKIDGLSGDEEIKNTRNIKIARTGRVRSCKPTSAKDDTCSTPTFPKKPSTEEPSGG